MGNGCSKSIILSSSPSLLPDLAANDNDDNGGTDYALYKDKQRESTAATTARESVLGSNGSGSVSADSKDNAEVPIPGGHHHDRKKQQPYVLRQAPVDAISDGCIDLILGSLSQEVLFQLLHVFRQQCAAERRRMLSPRVDTITAAAATGQTASSHNMMPTVSVGSTSHVDHTMSGDDLLSLLDRSYKRLSLNKDSLYSLFPSIHNSQPRHLYRQLVRDLLLLYDPLDPSSQSLINDRAQEEIGRFMRSCSLVTPSQLLRAFQIASHLPACALLRDFSSSGDESTSQFSEGNMGLLDQQCTALVWSMIKMMMPCLSPFHRCRVHGRTGDG